MSAGRKWLRRIVAVALVAATCTAYLIYSHTALDRQIAAEEARLTALGVNLKRKSPPGGGRFLRYAAALAELGRLTTKNRSRTTRDLAKLQEPALREILILTKDREAPIAASWDALRFGGAMTSLIRMTAINRIAGEREEALKWLRAAHNFGQDYRNDETRPDFYVARLDSSLGWEAGACLKAFSGDPECLALVREILDSSWLDSSELLSSIYAEFAALDVELARGTIPWDGPCTPAGKEGEVALRLYQVGTTRKSVRLRLLTCLRRQAEVLQDASKTFAHLSHDETVIWEEFSKGALTDSGAFAAEHLFPFFSSARGLAQHYCGALARSRLLAAGLALTEAAQDVVSTQLLADPKFADPYSGAPFVYRATKAGFRLYSVGPNGIDDGGYGEAGDDQELGMSRSTRDL